MANKKFVFDTDGFQYYHNTYVKSPINAAINALDASVSKSAGADGLALSVTEENGKVTAINGSIASNTYDSYGAASAAQSEAEALISAEKTRAQTAEQLLQEQYDALTQSDIIVGALPASGTKNKIYRVPGTTSYSDYMWNGSSFVKMATYDNAIDDTPTTGSDNLVKSGGVAARINQLDDNIQNLGKPANGSVWIEQVDGGIIKYKPKHWINEYEKATIEFSFKSPTSAPAATRFLFTSKGVNGNDYFYYLSGGGLSANIGGAAVSLSAPASFNPNTDYIVRWEKDGTTQKFYINGTFVNSTTATLNNCQEVYVGCYPDAPAVNALIGFYSIRLYDGDGILIEEQDASDSFIENTGKVSSTANFAEYYDKNVIFSSAYYLNETISISNRVLYGDGCRILCGANAKIIIGEGAAIQGFTLIGDWNPTRTTSAGHYAYDPIMTDADIADVDNYTSDFLIALRGTNASVLNCIIRNIGKTAILCDSLDAYTGSKQVNINGNELFYNKCGIAYLTEFATIGANRINACLIGIYAKGGNLSFVNNKILMADCGIIVGNTGNGGHSEFTGNEIAHCGKYGIYCPELGYTLGNTYSGGQIFDAGIKLINACGFIFVGCRMDTWYELTWKQSSYPHGIDGNAVHSCYITNSYSTIAGKPLFYYPDGGLSLKNNLHPGAISDSDVNN